MKRITVAGLRKLAERKGAKVYIDKAIDGGLTVYTFICGSEMTDSADKRILNAALSSLPDKPKDKKRGEK